MTVNLKILVVEDELLMGLQFKYQLESAGFKIIGPVSSVEGALAVIEEEAVSAALLDYKLYGEDCRQIAQALARKGVPYVIVTGNIIRQQSTEFGETLILRKPVNPDTLVSTLEEMCSKGRRENNPLAG